MIGRPTYKAPIAILNQQCEVREGKVVVKARKGPPILSGTKETRVALSPPHPARCGPVGSLVH